MPSKELLGTYLTDHFAGASAGAELAQKLSSANAGTEYGSFLSELARDIDQDRSTLEDLMNRVGIEKNPIKEVGGWLMEKLSRVKLNDAMTGSTDLKHLLEFEALSLGIEGKLVMWQAIKEIRGSYPELADVDLDSLVKRAEAQRASLEEHRREAARRALG